MKKAYITPSIEVCNINGAQIMQTASLGVGEPANDLGKAESFRDLFYDEADEEPAGWN